MSKYLIVINEEVPVCSTEFADHPFICVSTGNDVKNVIKHLHTEDKLIDETFNVDWNELTVEFAVVDADGDSDQVWHHWKLKRILSIREI